METDHNVKSMLTELQPSTPLVTLSFLFVVIVFMRLTVYPWLIRKGFTLTRAQIEVDEDLPHFFSAVKLSDADWVVYENKNLRETYGFDIVQPYVEE